MKIEFTKDFECIPKGHTVTINDYRGNELIRWGVAKVWKPKIKRKPKAPKLKTK